MKYGPPDGGQASRETNSRDDDEPNTIPTDDASQAADTDPPPHPELIEANEFIATAHPETRREATLMQCRRLAPLIEQGVIEKPDAVDAMIAALTTTDDRYGDQAEIEALVADGLNGEIKNPRTPGFGGGAIVVLHVSAPPPTKIVQSGATFVHAFVPPDYLVDGILQRRYIYSMTARTGDGKTALALLFAASVALWRPIGSHAVEGGRVLILAGENPDDIRMRWIAMSDTPGMEFEIDMTPVNFIPGVFKLSEMVSVIDADVKARGGVALVIVDTSAAYFDGDNANDNVQQGKWARMLRSLVSLQGGPTVLVLCHPTKNAGDDNLVPYGGGAFLNEMDGNLTCRRTDKVVELHWQAKFRGPDFAPMSFLLRPMHTDRIKDSKGRLIQTVIATALSEQDQQALATTTRSDEMALLAAIAARPGRSLREYGTTINKRYANQVKRILDELKVRRLVTDGPEITDSGRIALNGTGGE